MEDCGPCFINIRTGWGLGVRLLILNHHPPRNHLSLQSKCALARTTPSRLPIISTLSSPHSGKTLRIVLSAMEMACSPM